MEEQNAPFTIPTRELRVERDAWRAYHADEKQRPLEEYALNSTGDAYFECPILLERTSTESATLLTCCRTLISDAAYAQLRGELCPFCRAARRTGYVFVDSPFGEKFLIDYDARVDTVGAMKTRIAQRWRTPIAKLRRGQCLSAMYPDDALLRQYGVTNGRRLFAW